MVDILTEKTVDAIFDDLYHFLPAGVRDRCPLIERFAYIKDNIRHMNNREIMDGIGVPPARGDCDLCSRCRD